LGDDGKGAGWFNGSWKFAVSRGGEGPRNDLRGAATERIEVSVSAQDKAPGDIPAENERLSWKAVAGTVALAAAIIVLATVASYGAALAFDAWSAIHEPRAFAAGELEALMTDRVAAALFAFQLVTVGAVVLADARLRTTFGTKVLSFAMPRGGFKTLALAVLALISLATCFASLVFTFNPDALRSDLAPFAEMMRSRTWWLILLAAGIGAPLAEEFLFRGLLFGALRRSPLGFAGATAVTSLSWSLLHANYSVYGLTAITLIGIYLAWLRERTGTLLTPIVCHGAYNSLIILLMVLAPDNSLGSG
jgi:hypothetical protein